MSKWSEGCNRLPAAQSCTVTFTVLVCNNEAHLHVTHLPRTACNVNCVAPCETFRGFFVVQHVSCASTDTMPRSGPCRFGFACTRVDCFYQHPGGRSIDQRFDKSLKDGAPVSGVVCRFGTRCTRSDCRFLHSADKPSTNAVAIKAPDSNVMPSGSGKSSGAVTGSGVQSQNTGSSSSSSSAPCRYGLGCRYRSTCRFNHPDDNKAGDRAATSSGGNRPALADDVTSEGQESYEAECDLSSAADSDDADYDHREDQLEDADADFWQQQQRQQQNRNTWTAWFADDQAQAGTVYSWLAIPGLSTADGVQRQQLTPPGKPCGKVVSVTGVGPALVDHLRSQHGRELQGLRLLLSASRILRLANSNTLWASVPAQAAGDAHQRVEETVSAARAALSAQRLELPLVGGTRLLLLPGGGISRVLTRDVCVTLSVTELPATIAGQQVEDKLSSYGRISRVQVFHDTSNSAKQRQDGVTGAINLSQPASRSSWARVMFEDPGQAAVALASAEQLLPWKLKACKPPPVEHTFTQGALRLRVTWQVGSPTGNMYVELASASAATRVIQQAVKKGPAKNMLIMDTGVMVFVSKCRGTDRVLLLKRPRKDREYGTTMSEYRVREYLDRQCIPPAQIVSVSNQHVFPRYFWCSRGGKGGRGSYRSRTPGTRAVMEQCQWELEKMCKTYGQLRQVSLPSYSVKTGQATAFVSYQDPEVCWRAADALHRRCGPGGSFMEVNPEYCMTLAVDARTLSAVKPQLEAAMAQVRTRIPDITVTLLERPTSAAASTHESPTTSCSSTGSSRHSLGIESGGPAAPSSAAWPPCEGLLKITGSKHEALVAARALLEPAVAGRVFDGAGAADVAALMTPAGKAFLLGLEAQFTQQTPDKHGAAATSSAVHIRWERQLNRLRLYGPDSKLDQVEEAILHHLQSIQQHSKKTVRLPSAAYHQLVKGGREALEALQQQSGAQCVALDVVEKRLVVTGSTATIAAAEAAAVALSGHIAGRVGSRAAVQGGPEQEVCPVCMCDVDEPYSLGACGHSYCTSCLAAMLSSATRNNDFPVRCCTEACRTNICLADLTHMLPAVELSAAYKAAFRAYILANNDSWGCCPTADCPQVYQRGVARFQCDCCLATWCTLCLEPFHAGQSCQEYKAWKLAASQGDREFETWKQQNTKKCPGCQTAIEKSYGCNHMTCSKCNTHFCWLCRQKCENASSTYEHLRQKHGSIYD